LPPASCGRPPTGDFDELFAGFRRCTSTEDALLDGYELEDAGTVDGG